MKSMRVFVTSPFLNSHSKHYDLLLFVLEGGTLDSRWVGTAKKPLFCLLPTCPFFRKLWNC